MTDNRRDTLLRSAVVWDNHACLPIRADESFMPQLCRFREAGFTIVSINAGFGDIAWEEHLRFLRFVRNWVRKRQKGYCLVDRFEDIALCKATGKLGITFDVEGMAIVQDDVSRVRVLYEMGVRWMLIAYNRANLAGGGCLDGHDPGLTSVGRSIIDEMERVGMALCLSHTGPRTAEDAIEYCSNPPIFSHSNPFGDTPHPRNIGDHLIRACAAKGGVVGLSGLGPYLAAGRRPAVYRLLEQLRYVVDLVGAKHVGLGLDYVFDKNELEEFVRRNPRLFPLDINGAGMTMIEPEQIGQIAEGLARDNLSDEEIGGILGGNWMRIAQSVWR